MLYDQLEMNSAKAVLETAVGGGLHLPMVLARKQPEQTITVTDFDPTMYDCC